MRIVGKTLLVLSVLASLTPGCVGVKSRPRCSHVSEKNILFNPDWTGLATIDVVRAAWPATDAYESIDAEVSVFEERIIDYQGPSFRHGDQYYRRVNSVRTRRRHR